jgi:hypothetical protein
MTLENGLRGWRQAGRGVVSAQKRLEYRADDDDKERLATDVAAAAERAIEAEKRVRELFRLADSGGVPELARDAAAVRAESVRGSLAAVLPWAAALVAGRRSDEALSSIAPLGGQARARDPSSEGAPRYVTALTAGGRRHAFCQFRSGPQLLRYAATLSLLGRDAAGACEGILLPIEAIYEGEGGAWYVQQPLQPGSLEAALRVLEGSSPVEGGDRSGGGPHLWRGMLGGVQEVAEGGAAASMTGAPGGQESSETEYDELEYSDVDERVEVEAAEEEEEEYHDSVSDSGSESWRNNSDSDSEPLPGGAGAGVTRPPPEALYSLLLRLATGLCRLHAAGIVHGCLQASRVLLPDVADRGACWGSATLCGELRAADSSAAASSGWELSLSPLFPDEPALAATDSREQPPPSPADDMLAFGVLARRAAAACGVSSTGLRALVLQCLVPDPAQRPTACTAAQHLAGQLAGLAARLDAERRSLRSAAQASLALRLNAARERLERLQLRSCKRRVYLRVSRADPLGALRVFGQGVKSGLDLGLVVKFDGEEGVDAGGPARELLALIVAAGVNELFEENGGRGRLPRPGADRGLLQALGSALAKAAVEGVMLPEWHSLPPCLRRVLALRNRPPRSATALHLTPAARSAALVGAEELADYEGEAAATYVARVALLDEVALEEAALSLPSGEPVTTRAAAAVLVRARPMERLLGGGRWASVLALWDGFHALCGLGRALRGLRPDGAELPLLLGGHPHGVTMASLLACSAAVLRGFPFPLHWAVHEALAGLSAEETGQMLLFATGTSAVPTPPHEGLLLFVHCKTMPHGSLWVAHTCNQSVDVPAHLPFADIIRQRAMESVAHGLASGYHLA